MASVSKINDAISDLQSSLRATEFILVDMGYLDPQTLRGHVAAPRPGIRIRGALSDRGRQKAAELFDRLDEDGDGGMTFDDFRAMKSLKHPYAFFDRHEYNMSEAWRMHLADHGVGTDRRALEGDGSEDGVGDGLLRVGDMVQHRVDIELADGLTADLRLSGLGYLPRLLERWALVKTLIEEAFLARKPDSVDNPDRLNREDASFILCNAGLCYSKEEYFRLMIRRARFEILSDELLAKALRNSLFLSPDRLGGLFLEGRILMPEDELDLPALSSTSPSHLTAWLLANRPEPAYPVSAVTSSPIQPMTSRCMCYDQSIYQKFLSVKYLTIRYLRKATRLSLWVHSFGTGIRDSFLFKGVNISGLGNTAKGATVAAGGKAPREIKRDKVLLRSTVHVGDVRPGKGEDGSGMYWKFSMVEQPSAFFERLHLPPESGACLAVDLTVRRDADDNDVKNAANNVKKFLSHHFAADLSLNAQFKGLIVFPTVNEGDGSRVIRCAICYKRAASIDLFLEHMHMVCEIINTAENS